MSREPSARHYLVAAGRVLEARVRRSGRARRVGRALTALLARCSPEMRALVRLWLSPPL